MKINILLFLLILFFCSCKKDKIVTPASDGELTVKINGTNWTGIVRTQTGNNLSIGIDKYKLISGVNIPWETFAILNMEKISGKQIIYKGDTIVKTYSVFTTVQNDGDVACDYFEVLETDSNNWVEITNQSNNYSEVWANFRITLTRTSGCASSPYSDTLRFTEGTFHVKF